jgi:hypothetical protein
MITASAPQLHMVVCRGSRAVTQRCATKQIVKLLITLLRNVPWRHIVQVEMQTFHLNGQNVPGSSPPGTSGARLSGFAAIAP